MFRNATERLGGTTAPAKLMALAISSLAGNPGQDFFGSLCIDLGLAGKTTLGQQYRSYAESESMAASLFDPMKLEACRDRDQDYLVVAGSNTSTGSLLIAWAMAMQGAGINLQQDVLFIGAEHFRLAAMAAYVQIALLGLPGYIIVGNMPGRHSNFAPLLANVKDKGNLWTTPAFRAPVWTARRQRAWKALYPPERELEEDDGWE